MVMIILFKGYMGLEVPEWAVPGTQLTLPAPTGGAHMVTVPDEARVGDEMTAQAPHVR